MKLQPNMGTPDKIIRTTIAMVIFALIAIGTISGAVATVLGIVAVIFVVTSVVSFCPLYKVFGFCTNREDQKTA